MVLVLYLVSKSAYTVKKKDIFRAEKILTFTRKSSVYLNKN